MNLHINKRCCHKYCSQKKWRTALTTLLHSLHYSLKPTPTTFPDFSSTSLTMSPNKLLFVERNTTCVTSFPSKEWSCELPTT